MDDYGPRLGSYRLRFGKARRLPAALLLAVLLLPSLGCASTSEPPPPGGSDPVASEPTSSKPKLLATLGAGRDLGAWSLAPLPPKDDRMQAVHAILLPSGKILIVNGSSLRVKAAAPIGPLLPLPVDTANYDVTNNTAIFDPGIFDPRRSETNTTSFRKIDSPPNPAGELPNDLFCGGHLHTPDGNVLFASGTDQYSGPGTNWTGTKVANVFDWQTETWKPGGTLEDGHWYPTMLPLADGRVAAISGWSAEQGIMSPWLEVYDWRQPPESAWTRLNLEGLPNSPFAPPERMDHYPRIHPLPQAGRYLVTGDGSGGGSVRSLKTFFMDITSPDGPGAPPQVVFEPAADRAAPRRIYGTATVDPNSPDGDILLIGGQLGTESALIGPKMAPKDPANAVTAQLERYRAPSADHPLGQWEVTEDFMGDRLTDARSNHFAMLLPTRQLLIMSGGRYRFFSPNHRPLLMHPDDSEPGGYRRQAMNPGTQPRIYHNTALLLPDGRIFVAGGNGSYAARVKKLDGSVEIRTDTEYTYGKIPLGYVKKGTQAIAAENYQIEFYYPPYLFLPGPRPVIEQAPETIHYGASHTLDVAHTTEGASLVLFKLGAATHGWDMGQRRTELDFTQDNGKVTFSAPAADSKHLHPPAYYMLFYVTDAGYPSIAKIVQLTDAAS